jgi:hypothetical protein
MMNRIQQITAQVLDEIVPDTWTTLGYDRIKQIQLRTAYLTIKDCRDMFMVDSVSWNLLNEKLEHFEVD